MINAFCFLLIASLLAPILGCDGDSQVKQPHEIAVFPRGGHIAHNASIIVSIRGKFVLANVMIDGVSVLSISDDSGVFTIPGELILSTLGIEIDCIEGGHVADFTLTAEGEDENSERLEFIPLDFSMVTSDYWPPRICGSRCSPNNGAMDVDPEKYKEKLIIAFNEPVTEAKVISTDPVFDYTENLVEDGMKLEITLVNYVMPYGTEFTIEINATDRAGNSLVAPKYSFTTSKEGA